MDECTMKMYDSYFIPYLRNDSAGARHNVQPINK